MAGPNPISRLAGWKPQMPASQGYVSIQQFQPFPKVTVTTPIPGILAPVIDAIGIQWAPGQGGDTPGGGGAAVIGDTLAVQTMWIKDGFVIPQAIRQSPGTVGFTAARRGRA